jgi:hypothetical protein
MEEHSPPEENFFHLAPGGKFAPRCGRAEPKNRELKKLCIYPANLQLSFFTNLHADNAVGTASKGRCKSLQLDNWTGAD